jgi:hypothetical protein
MADRQAELADHTWEAFCVAPPVGPRPAEEFFNELGDGERAKARPDLKGRAAGRALYGELGGILVGDLNERGSTVFIAMSGRSFGRDPSGRTTKAEA